MEFTTTPMSFGFIPSTPMPDEPTKKATLEKELEDPLAIGAITPTSWETTFSIQPFS